MLYLVIDADAYMGILLENNDFLIYSSSWCITLDGYCRVDLANFFFINNASSMLLES